MLEIPIKLDIVLKYDTTNSEPQARTLATLIEKKMQRYEKVKRYNLYLRY